MKRLMILSIIAILSLGSIMAQSQHNFLSYYDMRDFMQASPGAFKYGLYGFDNPAGTRYLNEPDIMFVLSGLNNKLDYPARWGLFIGNPQQDFFSIKMPSTGLGVISTSDSSHSVYDFRYSWGMGNKVWNFGYGVGYSFGDASYFKRSGIIYLGGLVRPMRELSIGLQKTFSFEKPDGETVAEIAVRPIGTYPLAVFADMAMFDNQNLKQINWSTGVSWEFLEGLRLNGRYFNDKAFSVGLDISLGNFGVASQSHFGQDNKYGFNTYSFRAGATDRTIVDELGSNDQYLKMDLKGPLNYRGFLWFDNSNKLLPLLEQIDAAKKDNSIKGLVINTSGMQANMEMLWEVREKLKEFREYGKKVIIFIDRVGIPDYQFASVADKIIMDPQGSLGLSGFAMGRSYYKQLLEDAGIGFEEFRYFKYKSALENFGRDNMSDGDREQRQKLLDDWYEFSRSEICASRGISEAEYDKIVDGSIMYTAKQALELKLVDTLARWNDAKDILKNLDADGNFAWSGTSRKSIPPYDDKWGQPSKSIAVIYALGACAMDDGIRARTLSAYIDRIAQSDIGAIVLRVDSPGGDGMASDIVAEVIRKYKNKKPIIVSQGAVAASGGYWLSMDADTIVAAPMTITGSIGVIGGWFYNKGLADSLGIKTEILKRGKYADLGYPFTLPIIPIGLPNRNLTEDERSQMEKYIKEFYSDFVTKVATGRDMKYDEIHEVAQGRVWSGLDGKKKGLVDVLGGLDKAIEIAKERAGYDKEDEVLMIEYPGQELFDWTSIFSTTTGIDTKLAMEQLNMLKFRIDHNGIPIPVMPIDYFQYVQDK